MKKEKSNLAASVTARRARQTGDDYQTLLTSFCFERSIGLTPTYWENASRAPQVRAFARRAGLKVGPDPGDDILSALRLFLLPVLGDLRGAVATPGTWPPGGPWQSREQVVR